MNNLQDRKSKIAPLTCEMQAAIAGLAIFTVKNFTSAKKWQIPISLVLKTPVTSWTHHHPHTHAHNFYYSTEIKINHKLQQLHLKRKVKYGLISLILVDKSCISIYRFSESRSVSYYLGHPVTCNQRINQESIKIKTFWS